MQPSRTERLNGIVAALSEYISEVRGYDMPQTAVLLDMAKLDLQTRIHAISDREFRALCEAIEVRQRCAPAERPTRGETTKSDGAGQPPPEPREPASVEVHRATARMPVSRRRSSPISARSRKAR
jgi:hypothetical protein